MECVKMERNKERHLYAKYIVNCYYDQATSMVDLKASRDTHR